MMSIRLKLTLWYCLLFGTIVAIVLTVVYFSHKEAHYRDIDMMLTNLTLHLEEEVNRQIDNGESLQETVLSTDSLSVTEIAIMVKNKSGDLIRSNDHPLLKNNQFVDKKSITKDEAYFETKTLENGSRVRTKIMPIFRDKELVGYIESAHSLKSIDKNIQKFSWIVMGMTVAGIVLASIAGWFLAKKTFRRVDLIGKTAQAIANSQNFEQRVLYIGPRDELGQLTETFNHMLNSLEKAYKNQQIFLSNASHELRAPLTTIRGNLDILHTVKNVSDKEKAEIISDIRNEAIRMSKLVSDLLLLARTDAGQTYQKNIINISEIATMVLEEMKSWKKNVRIGFELQENYHIWGDKDSVKQLLIILLENAINYTYPNGNVFVSIKKVNRQLILLVKDTGIGIRPEEQPFIFDRFFRSEEARKKFPNGTGLGLSIARKIVEEHNASIKVNGNYGEGTEFIVVFPLIK